MSSWAYSLVEEIDKQIIIVLCMKFYSRERIAFYVCGGWGWSCIKLKHLGKFPGERGIYSEAWNKREISLWGRTGSDTTEVT